MVGGGWVGQAITNPISGPSFDFTFTIGPELDNCPLGVVLLTPQFGILGHRVLVLVLVR